MYQKGVFYRLHSGTSAIRTNSTCLRRHQYATGLQPDPCQKLPSGSFWSAVRMLPVHSIGVSSLWVHLQRVCNPLVILPVWLKAVEMDLIPFFSLWLCLSERAKQISNEAHMLTGRRKTISIGVISISRSANVRAETDTHRWPHLGCTVSDFRHIHTTTE